MFWKFDEEDKVVEKKPEVIVPNWQEAKDSDYPNSDETGAEERFESRVAIFKAEDKPVYKHHGWWFIHNCVAHPLIGIFPCKRTFDFHDWTSKKINAK